MREKINRLAKGIVDYSQQELVISPRSIEEKIPMGRKATGELNIQEKNGGFVKGLAYSSDFRVRVIPDAFGGTRSRVTYEVDSSYLQPGDCISGEILLVTSGGEIRVPYHFQVSRGQSGSVLDTLKTAEDFTALVRKDPDTALRLIGYEDFSDAPFMKDRHVHTLLEGLKRRPDGRNSLEEFLVALGQKKTVRLKTDTRQRRFNAPQKLAKDELRISFSTWGYVSFRVTADGDFLSLPRHTYTSDEAVNGVCTVPYLVDPQKLHAGHNFGSIRIETVRETMTIPVEVYHPAAEERKKTPHVKENISRYIELRLKLEFTETADPMLLEQIDRELKRLREKYGDTLLLMIFQADLHIQRGENRLAAMLLDSHRGEMAEHRREYYVQYCYYIYLQLQLQERDHQKDTLIRLVKKYLYEEASSGELIYLWTKLDPSLYETPDFLLEELLHYYGNGCRSPLLYAAALKLYRMYPELFQNMEGFELQVMYFGVRRHLAAEDVALYAARMAAERKHFHKLTCRLLILMYQEFGNPAFLECVCGMLIKGNCRDTKYFHWYEEALKKGVSMTGLYEYYLYALPVNYGYLLPKEVLMYFSYGNDLDDASRSKLYTNILKYMQPEAQLYRQYEREMEQFTMSQLLRKRVNRRLVVLYQHMLYPELIDRKAAKVLPAILRTYRIRVENPNIRYVIVSYEELMEEDAYPVKDGVAYVPLYLDHSVILFQDQYGNRYSDISNRKIPAMEASETYGFLERCMEEYPEHPMLRLQNAGQILKKGIQGEEDLVVLRKTMAEMQLRPVYRRQILSDIIRYYQKMMRTPGVVRKSDAGYLLSIDPDRLSRKERNGISEALLSQGYYSEVWERVREYGCEGLTGECLTKLCSWKILKDLNGEDSYVSFLAWKLFENGSNDSVLLDYLCEYYNGMASDMYRLLTRGSQEHVELYDLSERLLAQMLFTGEEQNLDMVFQSYYSGRTQGESLIKAYFTRKSASYFMKDKDMDENLFSYLEEVVQASQDLHRVPTIYLLALCRYYAELSEMEDKRRLLCGRILGELLEEGRVFAWFKKLARFIPLPGSLTDKTILEYRSGHGVNAGKPRMMVRILPEEQEFHPEELKRVYADIYVAQKVLFTGETMEYRIYDLEDGNEILKEEGKLEARTEGMSGEGRFADLDGICRDMMNLHEEALKEKMKKYVTDMEIMEILFSLQ